MKNEKVPNCQIKRNTYNIFIGQLKTNQQIPTFLIIQNVDICWFLNNDWEQI